MNERNFVIKKLNEYIDNFDELSAEEVEKANWLVLTTTKHHIDELQSLVKRSQENTERLFEENDELQRKLYHYEDFVNDSGLTKRYEFYSKTKGVI